MQDVDKEGIIEMLKGRDQDDKFDKDLLQPNEHKTPAEENKITKRVLAEMFETKVGLSNTFSLAENPFVQKEKR